MIELSRKFSARNGFGPIQKALSEPPKGFDINSAFDWGVPRFTHSRELELLYVLAYLTLAEEAGIRQISPLIGLMKLKYGNFGKKGSVSRLFRRAHNQAGYTTAAID
jgi:hypothetical protein